jgi:hypothetical protein
MATINDILHGLLIERQQQLELSNSKVAEKQQQIEELHNECNAELQRQEDLKQEIHTISQQICVDFNEPELTEDNAAIRIQKIFQCFQIKIRRSKIPESFIKGLQDDTLKWLHLVYNFRTGEKRKCKHSLYNLSTNQRRTLINRLDITIYQSEKVVCKIPGCNDRIHPKDIDLHMEKEHLSVHFVHDWKDWTRSAENKAIFKAIKNQDFEEDCIICPDKLNNGDEIMYLPCAHVFHKKCIKEWFKKSNTCPCCRGISTADPDLKQYNVRRYVRNSNILIRNICHEICTAEKGNHERCTRLAKEGCNRCWQHGSRFGEWWG